MMEGQDEISVPTQLFQIGGIKNDNHQTNSYQIWLGESNITEQRQEISNNVVCATVKASDQPVHKRSLLRTFASRLNILEVLSY